MVVPLRENLYITHTWPILNPPKLLPSNLLFTSLTTRTRFLQPFQTILSSFELSNLILFIFCFILQNLFLLNLSILFWNYRTLKCFHPLTLWRTSHDLHCLFIANWSSFLNLSFILSSLSHLSCQKSILLPIPILHFNISAPKKFCIPFSVLSSQMSCQTLYPLFWNNSFWNLHHHFFIIARFFSFIEKIPRPPLSLLYTLFPNSPCVFLFYPFSTSPQKLRLNYAI